jgi:hypothetical protein
MKTLAVILAVLTMQLVAQQEHTQKAPLPQTTVQSDSAQTFEREAPPAVQQARAPDMPTASAAQPHLSSQPIAATGERLDEYESRLLERAETFYNNRMAGLLWTMSIIMTAGLAIVGILIPLLLEWQRGRSFRREMAAHLSRSEYALRKYVEEQTKTLRTELEITTATPLSMAFFGLSHMIPTELSPEAYGLTLQLHVLALKFNIISNCSGTSLSASEIIRLLAYQDRGREIKLETLKVVDAAIENMKGDMEKISNGGRRADMESQIKELQIFVHSLIQRKQQGEHGAPS